MTAGAKRPLPRTAGEMLALAREYLAAKKPDEARLEAELLVAHALGLDRLGLFLAFERPVEASEIDRARDLLVRRVQGTPVAYLTGVREFYARPFEVGPGVLVPRPETELLVDRARALAAGRPGLVVGDLGTGSGCLAVTLALELDAPRVVGLDVSAEALRWARANAQRHGAAVELLEGDGLDALAAAAPEGYDLLVSNPPYVDPATRDALAPEVRDHEPALALFAPAGDVDRWVRELVERAPALVRPGGALLVELGHDQGPRARALAERGPGATRLHRDLAGRERVLEVVYVADT